MSYALLGHRGARAECLENSASGFAHAQQLSVHGNRLDGVEFDIQMTADGQFVVVHDETLGRLAGEQSWLMDKPLTELCEYKQNDWSRFYTGFNQHFLHQAIMPLGALTPYLMGYRHIEFEIKTHCRTDTAQLVKNLLRLLSDPVWQALPITLTSFDTSVLAQLHLQQVGATRRYPTGLLLEPRATLPSQIAFLPPPSAEGSALMYRTLNLACALGCRQVGVYHLVLSPTLVGLAKRFGLQVTAWTVNEVNVARQLIAMGVDCVITDYPSTLLAALPR